MLWKWELLEAVLDVGMRCIVDLQRD